MRIIVLSVCFFVTICNASHGYGGHGEEHYAPPQYKYSYGVNDHHTGDKKQAWEHRDGDVVRGGYSFHEADGTIRVVEYTSDKHNGFNAVVKRIGHAHHPQVYGQGHHGHHGGNGGYAGESFVGLTHWGYGGNGHY